MARLPDYIFTVRLLKTAVRIYSLWFLGRQKQSLSDAVLWLQQPQKFIANIKIPKQSCISPQATCRSGMVHLGRVTEDLAAQVPLSLGTRRVGNTPCRFSPRPQLRCQPQPISIDFIFGKIYTLRNE